MDSLIVVVVPILFFSDDGTNFVGGSREILRRFREFLQESFGSVSIRAKHFIPAGAPHIGGLWEAGFKSFELHFRKQARNLKHLHMLYI